jgi:hypothetical protein
MVFARLFRSFRRPNEREMEAARPYRAALLPALARLQEISKTWVDFSILEDDTERLGNSAAVYRWELARLSNYVSELAAPDQASHVAKEASFVLENATRGCQLLATGHRFHKSETVCEGQTLLVEAADAVDKLTREIDRLAGFETPAPAAEKNPTATTA